jgi:hypothetical protein
LRQAGLDEVVRGLAQNGLSGGRGNILSEGEQPDQGRERFDRRDGVEKGRDVGRSGAHAKIDPQGGDSVGGIVVAFEQISHRGNGRARPCRTHSVRASLIDES